MTNFAIIDNYSGFVWGVVEADDAISACAKLDADIGSEPREYDCGINGDQGYIVYEAPAGFDVTDGQDEVEIERVASLDEVARIGWKSVE